MSGIYIPGMEMPTSCYACMFFAQTDYWNKEDEADILSRCKRTGEKTWESVNGYLPNCPLVPVPDHGRLIDADAAAKQGWTISRTYSASPTEMVYEVKTMTDEVLPTIIQADQAEEVDNGN